MSAKLPQGWRIAKRETLYATPEGYAEIGYDAERINELLTREYPCGARAEFSFMAGGRLQGGVWRDAYDGGTWCLLPAEGLRTLEESIAAADEAVAKHPPIEGGVDPVKAFMRTYEGEEICADVELTEAHIEQAIREAFNIVELYESRGGRVKFNHHSSRGVRIELRPAGTYEDEE